MRFGLYRGDTASGPIEKVLDAARARLTFDDDPAAFASLLAREAT